MKTDLIPSGFLPLSPIKHPWVKALCENSELLENAIDTYGSPVNIQHLAPFAGNIDAFKRVLDSFGIRNKIYFARKANKCISFPLEAYRLGEGVDTASVRELQQCLDAGIPAAALISTAAVKNRQLLELAIANEVQVVIDNLDECELVQSIAEEQGKAVSVCVRVGGFLFEGKPLHTRFGWPIDKAESFIVRELGSGNHFDRLRYSGLHFHLNGYSVAQRGEAIQQCLNLIDALTAQGIRTESLDMGGGILINYLESEEQWNDFHAALKAAVEGRRPALTYRNDPLGMLLLDGKAYGEPTVYPYFNTLSKAGFLEEILQYKGSWPETVATGLRSRDLELRMEPGRSALDQCGITVAKVAFRREDTSGELLIGLEMNRTQLRSSSADFLLDPIHIPKHGHADSEAPVYGFLVGSYCLEQELILKRRVKFKRFPKVGDLVVFVNTAGYMMHFYESEAHLFALAKNVFYDEVAGEVHEDGLDVLVANC